MRPLAIMTVLELKGYMRAYKELLFFLLAGVIIGTTLHAGAGQLAERGSLFEPFTVGVVDHDGTPELIFVYDFFNEYIIDLEFMELQEAKERLSAGEIPAFIELPENFTRDVFYGVNSPFTVHLDGRFPLQGNLVQLLASGGIAYLSASQAGIYAAMGYAHDAGLDWAVTQRDLLIPVNMAFAQELILHDRLFTHEVIPLVEGDLLSYFTSRFLVFWHVLCLIALVKFLPWYSPGIMLRFKMAGVPAVYVPIIKGAALLAVTALISVPIMPFVGVFPALLSAVFVALLGLLSGKLFCRDSHHGARALFIFFVALCMYFASGGIVPFAFLPQEMHVMRLFSINYWVAVL